MNKTVYGVYTQSAEVVQAINSLKAKGYDSSDITVVADNADKLDLMGNYTIDKDVKTVSNDEDSFMDKVAKFFTLDTNNPVEEKMRTDYGFTSEESARYAEEVNNGKVLVLVDQDAQLGDTIGMDRTEDLNSGANASAALNTTDRLANDDTLTDEERRIKLREERLNVDKNEVKTGEVIVNKKVTETQKEVEVPVDHEEVYIERRKVTDRDTTDQLGAITDNEEIRIPVTEEKIEVTKKPVVTDEIVIGKEKVTDTKTVQDTVKKEDVQVDKDGNPFVNDHNTTTRMEGTSVQDSSLTDEDTDRLTAKPYQKNKIDTDNL
ncbi:YsnF/AvaK domain-containing protein [Pradoshia sp. D12]|uniref:YsnF/AvaK domain-containing protein n=1 Tax=Bacillaceae TaxID=186817 RepID=UPI001125C85D|nr:MULTISPECIES: YsnF/AvaK domain-containing protein [Bacillaceae]QFK71405.1 YsnF/AvaK domain-containing protein [Pradoshia sp. D12]TPF73200.1 YsnF/AvaK domain-containing protein [Bacillus sp. D12]